MMKKQTTVTTLPRVLIVDDDAMVRLLAISALGQLDLDLHEAGDGQTCLRPRDRFWGLGCPKIYHEAEDTLAPWLAADDCHVRPHHPSLRHHRNWQ